MAEDKKKAFQGTRISNAKFASKNDGFKEACELVNLPPKGRPLLPSKRQASRFRRRMGIAYQALQAQKKMERKNDKN